MTRPSQADDTFLAAKRREAAAFFARHASRVIYYQHHMQLREPPWVVIDTETTGLDTKTGEVLEVAVVDALGEELVNTCVYPGGRPWVRSDALNDGPDVPASHIHGITPSELFHAPTWDEVRRRLREAIRGRHVLAYNANFDRKMLTSNLQRRLMDAGFLGESKWSCVMRMVAKWAGKWSAKHGDFTHVSLADAIEMMGPAGAAIREANNGRWGEGSAHRAAADADLARRLVFAMAERACRRAATRITPSPESTIDATRYDA